MSERSFRQLAAIVFTDIVGYTSLMQRDEALALTAVNRHQEVLEDRVAHYHGEVLQYYGDGSLSIFKSVSDAVECAMEIQLQLKNDPKVPLRIGIHIGEILFENGKAFGDGVNVASRIESLGQAGTVLFSKEVYNKIRNRSEFKVKPLGAFEFKNVEEPLDIYALANEGMVIPVASQLTGKLKPKAKNAKMGNKALLAALLLIVIVFAWIKWWPDQAFDNGDRSGTLEYPEKSIAVLPFQDLSPDRDQEYFSDGIADEILNALAQLEGLKVIGRTSSFAFKSKGLSVSEIAGRLKVSYVLDGSVRKMDDQVKINAYLINAQEETQIWADTFNRNLDDIFAIQNEIALSLANELRVSLLAEQKKHLVTVNTTNQKAYDLYLRGKWYTDNYLNTRDERDFQNAIQLLQKAIDEDPEFPQSYVAMAYLHYWRPGLSNTPDSVQSFVEKALSINSELPEAYALRGWYHYEKGELEKAEENYKRSMTLNPNDDWTVKCLSMVYFHQANYEKTFELLQKIDQLNPNPPPVYLADLGDFYLSIGDYDQAQRFYEEALQIQPDHAFSLRGLSWLSRIQGKIGAALEISNQLLDLYPENANHYFDKASLLAINKAYADALKVYVEGLSKKENGHSILQVDDRERMYGYILWRNMEQQKAISHFEKYIDYCQEQIASGSLFGKSYAFYDLASIYAFLGQKEKAYQNLTAYAKSGFNFGLEKYIQIDPLFENLWEDDEFREIIHRATENKTRIRERIKQLREGGTF